MCKIAVADKQNVGVLESFYVFEINLQLKNPFKNISALFLAPFVVPDLPSYVNCSNDTLVTISLLAQCSAPSLPQLIKNLHYLFQQRYEYIIVHPSSYWIFAHLGVPITHLNFPGSAISKRRLRFMFSRIFDKTVKDFAATYGIFFTSFSTDPILNLNQSFVNQVNLYFKSRIPQLNNVFYNPYQKLFGKYRKAGLKSYKALNYIFSILHSMMLM